MMSALCNRLATLMIPIKVSDQAAFCLHRTLYGDTSTILHLLTQDFGRVSVLVKGAKKRKNQANFQLFQPLQVSFSGKSDLKTLTAIESEPLQLSAKTSTAALYVNELLMYFLSEQQACHTLFLAYKHMLLTMNDANLEIPLRQFEFKLLNELGVLADMTIDFQTEQAIAKQAYYVYYPDKGFTLSSNEQGYLGEHILKVAQQNYDTLSLQVAKRMMRCCIDWQLAGKQLKTRQLYKQLYHSKPQHE